MASQEDAAARPAWSGDRRDRVADLRAGWQVWHFTGKGSGERAAAACRPLRIIVASEPVDLDAAPRCLLLDPQRLKATGAASIDFREDVPILHHAAPLELRR